VNDPVRIQDITTFPNPVNELLNIYTSESLQGKASIVISDLLGHTVYKENIENIRKGSTYSIGTGDFRDGIYMLKISTDKGSVTRKIVVKH
jgi:hypothetical protein